MELKYSNINRPSNKKFKKIADTLLYCLPLYTPILAGLEPVSPEFTLWAITIINVTVVTLKGITKFTAEEEVVDEVTEVKDEA